MSPTSRPPRFKFNAPLEIQWGAITVQTSVCEISTNGMFIETANPFWIGATFSATLRVNPSLEMYCTVHRIEPSRGMAVRVAFANKESDERFAELVDQLARK